MAVLLFLSSFSWWSASVGEYASGGVGLVQLVFRIGPVGLAGILLLARDARQDFAAFRALFSWPVVALLWYALVGAAAGLASPLPSLALWKSIEVSAVAYLAAHAALLPRERLARLLVTLLRAAILLVVWVAIEAVIAPAAANSSHTSRFMISSYFPIINSNGVGTWAALAVVALAAGTPGLGSRAVRRVVFVVCLAVLALAQSRTGWAAAAIGLGALALHVFRRDVDRALLLTAGAAAAAAFATLAIAPLLEVAARGQSMESLLELSGRTDYWSAGLSVIFDRPWVGGGLATGSRFIYQLFADVFGEGGVNLHSAPLEILLGAGIIGGLPLLAFYAATALRAAASAASTRCAADTCPWVMAAALALALVPRFFLSIAMASFTAELILIFTVGLLLRRPHAAPAPEPAEPVYTT